MPSPLLPSFTALYRLLAARDNLLALWSEGTYGLKIRCLRYLRRQVVVAHCPAAVRQVLIDNAKNYRKSDDLRRALGPLLGNGTLLADGEHWVQQRRGLAPVFQPQRLPAFSATVLAAGDDLLTRWAQLPSGSELELDQELAVVTADVISRALFSTPLDGLGRAALAALTTYQDTLGRLDVLGLLGLPDWLPRPGLRRGQRAGAQVRAALAAQIERRRPLVQDDLFALLIADQPAPDDLLDRVAALFFAGHETTALTLSWALYLLACHPAAEAAVHDELAQVLGTRGPLHEDLPALTYTRAVVMETLRLYPPIHVLTRQALAPDHIGACPVAGHALVVIAPWVLHRHRSYWPEPDLFRPERFLGGEAVPDDIYIPFGAGPRLCPGRKLGMTETVLLLALITQRYRLRLRSGQRVEPQGRLSLRPRHGLPLRLERR